MAAEGKQKYKFLYHCCLVEQVGEYDQKPRITRVFRQSIHISAIGKKQSFEAKGEDVRNDEPTAYEELSLVVVPSLPRAASIEWHAIAVVDEPQQRGKRVLMRSLESCEIKCEAVQSRPTHTIAVAISLTLTSALSSTINLNRVLHDMVEIFKLAIEEMSGDADTIPLGFRTFYRMDIVEMSALQAGLQRSLEEQMGKKIPAVIMVPVSDLPGMKIIDIACWLSS
ncbi:hypothetical protein JRQ81_000846 [Phrynocephalus forsythii]|uniref:Uncharacterized protein n=1 Tax=Phrynocephalus forsythii TaxID=171643 RepID=A0A9Q1B8E0_9SAUR|nr:hypothetical protein JRQ81_000846 [Phrynocephalus forsythii]